MLEKIIKDYVKKACRQETNMFSDFFYNEHIKIVLNYCDKLNCKFKADKEIIHIAAYLHDIAAILDFNSLATHHIASAKLAQKILKEKNYPADKSEKILQCIKIHSSPVQIGQGINEEIILSNADAISQIVNPAYWLYYIFKVRDMGFNEGKKWYLNRIRNHWETLIDEARELIYDKYHTVKNILE